MENYSRSPIERCPGVYVVVAARVRLMVRCECLAQAHVLARAIVNAFHVATFIGPVDPSWHLVVHMRAKRQ